jgi:hypothetical protein
VVPVSIDYIPSDLSRVVIRLDIDGEYRCFSSKLRLAYMPPYPVVTAVPLAF